MKKIIFVTFFIAQISLTLKGQSGLGFYHMGRDIPHGTNTSPIFFPDANFYLGLGGAQFTFASPYDFGDRIKSNGEYNLNLLTDDLDNKDFLTFGAEVYALNLGLRINQKSYFTLFANAVTENAIQIPKKLVNFIEKGNGAFAGDRYEIDDLRVGSNTYSEIGFGYGREFSVAGKTLLAALRMKYLVGVAHVSVDKDSKAVVTTSNGGTSLNIDVDNGLVRTAGAATGDSYEAVNKGFAIDLGGEYDLTEKLSVSFTARDLGFIKWKQTKNYRSDGNALDYSGVDLSDNDDISGAVTDTLSDVFDSEEFEEEFSKSLNPEFYYGARYKLTERIYASATLVNYLRQGRLQTGFGTGITANFLKTFTLSGTIAKVPENGIDFGAGIGMRLAILQLYAVVDGLSSLDIKKASYAQVNVGASLMFGRPSYKAKRQEKRSDKLKPEKVKKNKQDLGNTKEDRESKKKALKEKMKKLDQDKKKFEKKLE